MCNVPSRYFSFLNNKPSASWVAHIIRNFITCYSCLYYSSLRLIPRIAGNTKNHGNDGEYHKSYQILNQIKRNINKLRLGKITLQKAIGIKFSVDSTFSNIFYGKKRKPENAEINRKLSKLKKHPVLAIYRY